MSVTTTLQFVKDDDAGLADKIQPLFRLVDRTLKSLDRAVFVGWRAEAQ
jgi:hypothetical protein